MRRKIALALPAALLVAGTLAAGFIDVDIILRRGDANGDGTVDVSDTVYIAAYLFQGGPEPPCLNQADANDDGIVDSSDPVFITSWLYNGGAAPPAPGPFGSECTEDETPPNPGCSSGCP